MQPWSSVQDYNRIINKTKTQEYKDRKIANWQKESISFTSLPQRPQYKMQLILATTFYHNQSEVVTLNRCGTVVTIRTPKAKQSNSIIELWCEIKYHDVPIVHV